MMTGSATATNRTKALKELAALEPDVNWAALLSAPGRATPEETAEAFIAIGCDPDDVKRTLSTETS